MDGLLRELSSSQLAEWLAYFQLEPFGEERDDLRMGIVASTIANVNRSQKRKKPYEPRDFMPQFDEDEEDPEETAQRLMAQMKAALGGK